MARPKTLTEEVRERLMSAALATVSDQGLAAVAVRAVAERAGASTTAVYALYGSKEALQQEVLQRGFEDFAAHQLQVPITEDPVRDIAGLGAHYVQWALERPRLYEAMFGRAAAGLAPTEKLVLAGARAMAPVSEAVDRALATGTFREAEAATVVTSLWSQVHGLATLMIAGHLPEGADPAEAALAAIRGWLREAA